MNKEAIRQEMKQKKESLTSAEIALKSEKITNDLFALSYYQKAKALFCYVSFNQEVRTFDIIKHALKEGKEVYVPKIIKGNMIFIRIMSLSDLEPGFFGILEPKKEEEIIPGSKNLVIVPGLAFDKAGRRIGYGKGFYDRYFQTYGSDKFIKIALTYDFQVVEELEEFPDDVKMDMILTEQGAYSIE